MRMSVLLQKSPASSSSRRRRRPATVSTPQRYLVFVNCNTLYLPNIKVYFQQSTLCNYYSIDIIISS